MKAAAALIVAGVLGAGALTGVWLAHRGVSVDSTHAPSPSTAADVVVDAAVDAVDAAPPPDASVDAAVVAPQPALVDDYGGHGLARFGWAVTALAIQPDQRVVVCGTRTLVYGQTSPAVAARLLADGSLDDTFGTAGVVDLGDQDCRGVAVLTDGRVVATGTLVTVLSSTGAILDRPSVFSIGALTVAATADGGFVVAAGDSYSVGINSFRARDALLRYDAELLPLLSFGTNGVQIQISDAFWPRPRTVGLVVEGAGPGEHVLVGFYAAIRAMGTASGQLDGTFSATVATDGAVGLASNGHEAAAAFFRDGVRVVRIPSQGTAQPELLLGTSESTGPGLGAQAAPVVSDSLGRFIVLSIGGGSQVHAWRLESAGIDQAWSDAHSFAVSPDCPPGAPCGVCDGAVSGAVITGDDSVVVAGTCYGTNGYGFVAKLRP